MKEKMLNLVQKINSSSEILCTYTVDNLRQLIAVPGLSGFEKDRCILIKKLCNEANFDEVYIDGLGSVVGRIGKGPKIIAFDAHIDTVQIGDIKQWKFDPHKGEIKDGYLYGRGASDQLGGAAAMISAGRMLKLLKYKGDYSVYFTFTVMEEDCDGLAWLYLIENEGLRPDCIISTEPSLNHLHRGHRGRMEIEIQLKGKSCHGSRPLEGDSAAYKAARAALAIERLNEDLIPDSDDFLGKGTITVSSIHVQGPSQCSVPDEAVLYMDRRLTWGETAPLALSQVEQYVEEALGEKPYKVYMPNYLKRGYKEIDYFQELYFPTWKLNENHHLVTETVKAFEELFGKKMIIEAHVGSTNAVAFAGKHQIPAIIVGPGNPAEAHKSDEKVMISNVIESSALYALLPYVL